MRREENLIVETKRRILQEAHFNKFDIIRKNEVKMDIMLDEKKKFGDEIVQLTPDHYINYVLQKKWLEKRAKLTGSQL